MGLRARIIRMWMEMHLIFLYIYIILAVAVFNNKFNNLHFWTRVPLGQASGMRQGRAWGSGSSFGWPWPSNTRPCPEIPGPAWPCTTLTITDQDRKITRPIKTATAVQSSVHRQFEKLKTDQRLVPTSLNWSLH